MRQCPDYSRTTSRLLQDFFKYSMKPLQESFKIASRLSNIISSNFFQLHQSPTYLLTYLSTQLKLFSIFSLSQPFLIEGVFGSDKTWSCTRSWCYKIELRLFYLLFHLEFYLILISFSVGKMSGKNLLEPNSCEVHLIYRHCTCEVRLIHRFCTCEVRLIHR